MRNEWVRFFLELKNVAEATEDNANKETMDGLYFELQRGMEEGLFQVQFSQTGEPLFSVTNRGGSFNKFNKIKPVKLIKPINK